MQRPFDRHFISSSGHSLSQLSSSELSPQSSVPSQIVADGVQLLFLHWKKPLRHCRGGHVSGSSEPSLQSFSPSHLKTDIVFPRKPTIPTIHLLPEPWYAFFVISLTLPLSRSTVCNASFSVWSQIELIGACTSESSLSFFTVTVNI